MKHPKSLSAFLLTCLVGLPIVLASCMQDGVQSWRSTSAPMASAEEAEASPIAVRPGVEDEVWIIARDPAVTEDEVEPEGPGTGCLVTRRPGVEDEEVPVPLKHTDVQAAIAGFVATVDVTQSFHNPWDVKIEAVYTFPLPTNSAVHEFVMTIGERKIRGIIREREEAERTYLEARRQGYTASLLVQERPNVFTQSVANIEPGKEIDVTIRYLHTLTHHDGWFEYRFPMVVAPRYNPPGSTDGIGAVPRGAAGTSGQSTEVQYLHPTERSGHDISLVVDLATGFAPQDLHSPTHAVDLGPTVGPRTRVTLREFDSIPNRDFVLRYRLDGEETRTALMTSTSGGENYFALLLVPPPELRDEPRRPIELIFVVDRSGSMDGPSIELARQAVKHSLGRLNPDDTFNIVTFANDATSFRGESVAATEKNLKKAARYLKRIDAGGGTEMVGAVRRVFNEREDGERTRCVAFLTDGHVGNEVEVLSLLSDRLGNARVYSFAVGSASNQYLAETMARLGRGAVSFLGLEDDPRPIMDAFLDRAARPVLAEVELDWGGLEVTDVFPRRIPDLVAGRPVVVTGRIVGEGRALVAVEGSVGGRRETFPIDAAWHAPDQPGIPLVWARRQLAELNDEALIHNLHDDAEWQRKVLELALSHSLLSDFTAFLAVDSSRRTEGDHGITVPVPVEVPAGVRYDTTVGGEEPRNR